MHKSIAPISLLTLLAVSPAQAAPTAIAACGTIGQSGSYELAQNLSASGTCLVNAQSFNDGVARLAEINRVEEADHRPVAHGDARDACSRS